MGLKIKFKNSYFSYFLMYQFYYFSFALFATLISVYLLDMGYNATEAALLLSVSFVFSMIVQPIIGYLCDRFNGKKVNGIALLIAGFGALIFMVSKELIFLILFYGLVISMINGTNPVIEKMATTSRFEYGKIRIWGTIGYATGSQIAGVIYQYISPKAIFIVFFISIIITIIGICGTVEREQITEVKVEEENNKNHKGYFNELFKNKKYLVYLLIAGIFFGATNISNVYIPVMFQEEGLELAKVSFILFLAVICEAPVVLYFSKFMDRISNKKLLIIAFSLIIIQFFCYSMVPILSIKIMATFLAKHVAGMLFIMINLKVVSTIVDVKYQISALALVATISRNLSTIIFQNISGFILDNYNFQVLFLMLMVMVSLGLLIVFFYKIPSGNNQKLFNTNKKQLADLS